MSIQDLIAQLRGSTASGVAAAVVVALVALVVFGAVAAVLRVLRANSPAGHLEALLSQRVARRRPSRWLVRLVPVASVLALLVLFGGSMGLPAACSQCHRDDREATALASSAHKGVACMACHGLRGAAGPARQLVTYARWLTVYSVTQRDPAPAGAFVDANACLACHSGIAKTVVSHGIRVRHSDFAAGVVRGPGPGVACGQCHNSTAHGTSMTRPTVPTMGGCVLCHDGTKAPAACPTCHVQDLGLAYTPTKHLPKVLITPQAESSSCYQCHAEKPCLTCHGVTMPHPPGWVRAPGVASGPNLHARPGFANRDVCWRCHYSGKQVFVPSAASCSGASGSCHGLLGSMHGGKAWIAEHGLEATGRKTGTNAACYDCHATDFCSMCHTDSFAKLYNPKVGPDHYKRDIPPSPQDLRY
jgi:hypothetical protein